MSPLCLIGESDAFLARLLARFCEVSGLSVVRAQAADEIVALAQMHGPDLIIFDVELPGERCGWEAIKTLKESPDWRPIPLISCSWVARPEAMGLVPDCSAHLQKPELHYDDFVAALRDAGFDPVQR